MHEDVLEMSTEQLREEVFRLRRLRGSAYEMIAFATEKIETPSGERDEKLREYWLGFCFALRELFEIKD